MSDADGPIRIYRRREAEPECIATCDEDSVIFALRTLREEEQIRDADAVGIMERPNPDEPGRWLVKPWTARSLSS